MNLGMSGILGGNNTSTGSVLILLYAEAILANDRS